MKHLLFSSTAMFNMNKRSKVTFANLQKEDDSNSECEEAQEICTQGIMEEMKIVKNVEILDSVSLTPMIQTIELMWDQMIGCKLLMSVLMSLRTQSMKKKIVQEKRLWENASQAVLDVMKQLKKNGIKYDKCYWKDFESAYQGVESSMTYLQIPITEDQTNDFISAWEVHLREPSSSSVSMDVTGTSSMTARIPAAPVDVLESKQSEILDEDTIEELFEPSTSVSNTGSICWNISKTMNEGLSIWKLPVKRALNVIKLEIYPYNEVKNMDKKNWWKKSKMRTLFTTSSHTDVKEQLIRQVLRQVAKDLKEDPNATNEVKATNFWTS